MLSKHSLKKWLSIVVVILLVGCDAQQGLKKGDTAPEFSKTDIYGKTITLSSYKGKIVVLYFWASCCNDSLKLLEPFHKTNRANDIEILAINSGDASITAAYAKDNGITFTMLTDKHLTLQQKYQATGFPTIFILDKNGIIKEKILGDMGVNYLGKLIQIQVDAQKKAAESYERIHSR